MAKQVKTLIEFKNGEIMDKINTEFLKVAENIANKNTSVKPRKIKCEITFMPDDNRELIQMSTVVTSVLQPTYATKTAIQMSMGLKGVSAMELTGNADGQVDIFGEVHETKVFTMPLVSGGSK